jgi:hypothetical protein
MCAYYCGGKKGPSAFAGNRTKVYIPIPAILAKLLQNNANHFSVFWDIFGSSKKYSNFSRQCFHEVNAYVGPT